MTRDETELLTSCEGRILAVELNTGEQFFAEVIMVVDEPPTPDVFLLRVVREADGSFTAGPSAGESILLDDISRIALLPGVEYPGI